MNLMPLIERIHAAGLAEKEATLFLQMLPAECEKGVLLRVPLTGTRIDPELPKYFRGKFQLIVRSHDYDEGRALIESVMDLLTFGELTVGSQAYQFCRATHLPVAFPLSSGNLIEYTVPFECAFVEQ